MPKFLDAPSWYGSDGRLTSDASITSGVLQVTYDDPSTQERVMVYIPVLYSEDFFSGASDYISIFATFAILNGKPYYSCCTGQIYGKNNKVGNASLVVFYANGTVTFYAPYSDTIGNITVTINLAVGSDDTERLTVKYFNSLDGLATLK